MKIIHMLVVAGLRSPLRLGGASAVSLAGAWLLLLSMSVLAGCSGQKILQEQAQIGEQALSVVTPQAKTLQITKGIPAGKMFHVGVRVSEAFMNRAATELLKAEVIPSTFENPVEVTLPPFGTRVAFRPALSVQNPRLVFTGACPECLQLSTQFVGKLALDLSMRSSSPATRLFDSTALSGEVTLNARLIPMYTGGIPSLGIQIQPLGNDDLRISTSVPVAGADQLITAAVRSQIRAALANPRLNTFPMLPIRALAVPGSSVGVNEISYALLTRPEGELFIGILLNLQTSPEIDMETRGRRMRGSDFAVLAGQGALTDATRVWMAEGLVPAVYDYNGNPASKGPVTVELKRLNLFEDRYEAFVRMWHTGTPPFWREFKMTGVLGVRSDSVTVRNDKAETVAKAGPNALIDLALKLQNTSLNRALEGVGSRMPRQVGFPFGAPAKLIADVSVEELQTDRQRMTVYGDVTFTHAPGKTPAVAPAR